MQAVGGEFFRRDVVSESAGSRAFRHEVPDHLVELPLGPGNPLVAVQERHERVVAVSTRPLGNESVGLQHGSAAWYTLIPLAVASLLTGLVQSLGTTWGLFRHYWVLFKLLISVGAIVVLLMYTETLGYLAGVAAVPDSPLGMLRSPSVLIHAVLALVLLLLATVLAVYKPRGRTPYAIRTRPTASSAAAPQR